EGAAFLPPLRAEGPRTTMKRFALTRRSRTAVLSSRSRAVIATSIACAMVLGACSKDEAKKLELGQTTEAVGGSGPGMDGTYTVTAPQEVVNQYAAVAQDAVAGQTWLTVNAGDFGGLTLTPGSLLMVIQMQGATVSTAPDRTFG